MVRRLAGLKARLTWNGVRADVQRRFGLPVALILLTWLGVWLADAHLETARSLQAQSPEALASYMGWVALFAFIAWVALPVVIFPLDENLDPEQLALLPITPNHMVAGLVAASFIAPSTVIPILLIASNSMILSAGWWMVLPASLVFLGLLAVGSQLFSAAISAILRTRRGRDIATFLILGIAGGCFLLYRSVSDMVTSDGLTTVATSHSLVNWSLLIPPVAAQQAILDAADGNPISALISLSAAIVGLLVLTSVWKRLLAWLLTTPEQRNKPNARARRRGMAYGPWGVVATLARKEFRFYVRDPRQRLVWTGTVIFVGLAIGGVVMNATGFFDFQDREWAPIVAPVLVLFVGLPIALNLFGWERNAASYLFVLPAKPRQLLLGKNLAVASGLAVETAVLTIGLGLFSGNWRWIWLTAPLSVAAIGCQLAVGNMVSVLAPLRLPREGTDVFAQSTEQGCLAIVSQTVSFFAIGILLVPPASVTVLTVDFGHVINPWLTGALAVVWGLSFYLLSLLIAGRLLKRRMPEVLAWIQVT